MADSQRLVELTDSAVTSLLHHTISCTQGSHFILTPRHCSHHCRHLLLLALLLVRMAALLLVFMGLLGRTVDHIDSVRLSPLPLALPLHSNGTFGLGLGRFDPLPIHAGPVEVLLTHEAGDVSNHIPGS